MSDRTTAPTNTIDVPHTAIPNGAISSERLQRGWCLMLTKSLWPTIDPGSAHRIAQWLFQGGTGGAA